jgi:signal peptidase II
MSKYIKFGIHRMCLILSLLFTTVGCDQITKVVARDAIPSFDSISYLHNTISLVHAENPGAFMSFGASLQKELRFWIFTFAVAVLLFSSLVFLLKKNNMSKWTTVATTLMVAGGIGNLIDRIHRGTVTDFINLGIGSWRTGIFNVADMAIVGGLILLFFIRLETPRLFSKKGRYE